MRVWILTSELPHEYAGGIARYVDTIARLLASAGCEVVIVARMNQAVTQVLAPGVTLCGIKPHDARYPYNVLSYWPALSYQLADEVFHLLDRLPPPDVIESQEYCALPYYLLQRKLTARTPLERVPLLLHMHSPYFEIARINQEPRYRFPEYWVGQMEKFCIVAADALLSPSRFLARSIRETLQRPLDITVIPYPCMFDETAVAAEQSGQRRIVYVGRLEVRKGVLSLIRSCSRLWEAGEDFQLALIGGDTPFKPYDTTVGAYLRQRYARWIEGGQLQLIPPVERAEVLAHMRRAWAVVVPSLWENFPNTCIEAMSVGQVVLASCAGGQAEMIETHGVNGLLFDWSREGDFENKLRDVLALSAAERRAIGERAARRIRAMCAPEAVVPQRIAHYEMVIRNYKPRDVFPTVNLPCDAGGALRSSPTQSATEGQPAGQEGLLSVIIPFYNLGAYVDDALDSVLKSTYTPMEVIIVNDGSTDAASLEALKRIEERRLPHVRIVHTANQGLAATRNFGAEVARGEFIAFLDADDMVESDYYARAIEVLRRYANVSFVYAWDCYFDAGSGIWPTWNAEFPYLLGHNMLSAFAVVRRSAFLTAARNKAEMAYSLEDFEGWIGLFEAGGVGVSLPFPLVRYRVRRNSMYRSAGYNQQLYLYDLITQLHADSYRRWGVELFNLQNANGPAYLWSHPACQTVDWESIGQIQSIVEHRNQLLQELQILQRSRLIRYIRFFQSSRIYKSLWRLVWRLSLLFREFRSIFVALRS